MIINVKAKHIKNGKPNSPNKCAVALSLKDMGYKRVHVNEDYIEADAETFYTSKKLEKFINDFDFRQQVKPTSFKLVECPYQYN